NGAWFEMQNLYNIPNLRLEAIDVMTNSFKSGPYRCVSHPNGTFALELTMEKAAYAIGMDPVAFRLKNLNEVGNPDTKAPFSNPGIRDCITAVRDALNWSAKWHAPKANQVRPGVYHGIGLAAAARSKRRRTHASRRSTGALASSTTTRRRPGRRRASPPPTWTWSTGRSS